MHPLNEVVEIELTDSEWYLLRCGLVEWGGPARLTDAMAAAMGFVNLKLFWRDRERLLQMIKERKALARWDWARALLATEIVFASTVMGAAGDWEATTGLDGEASFRTLRTLQGKLMATVSLDVMREEENGRYDPTVAETELSRWPR